MAQITADLLRSKFGFNDSNVINGIMNDPGQVERYNRELGGSTGASGGGVQDFTSYLAAQQAATDKAIAPAIQSLEEQKPITQQAYAQQATNLQQTSSNVEQRYKSLLDSLTGKETQEKAQVGMATSREFGKRGVPLSSGIYDQALIEKYQPISQYYSGLTQQTGVAREGDLMKIAQALAMNPIELQQALNQINQAQATLKMGGAKDSISNAINQQQFGSNLDLKNRELAQSLSIWQQEDPLRQAQIQAYKAQAAQTAGNNSGLPVVA